MKITLKSLPLSLVLLLAACSKQEPEPAATPQSAAPVPPVAPAASSAAVSDAQKAANASVADAQKSAADLNASAQSAIAQATNAAPPTPDGNTQTMTVLREAKTLFNEKKYPEALAALAQLSPATLSAEQRSMVEQLKAQIQSAMTGQAANEGLKSVGGLLNKKN